MLNNANNNKMKTFITVPFTFFFFDCVFNCFFLEKFIVLPRCTPLFFLLYNSEYFFLLFVCFSFVRRLGKLFSHHEFSFSISLACLSAFNCILLLFNYCLYITLMFSYKKNAFFFSIALNVNNISSIDDKN